MIKDKLLNDYNRSSMQVGCIVSSKKNIISSQKYIICMLTMHKVITPLVLSLSQVQKNDDASWWWCPMRNEEMLSMLWSNISNSTILNSVSIINHEEMAEPLYDHTSISSSVMHISVKKTNQAQSSCVKQVAGKKFCHIQNSKQLS